MKIEKLYTYPVKGLRAVELDSVTVTKYGFPFDRRFMLCKVKGEDKDDKESLQKMQVDSYQELVLFFPTLKTPSSPDAKDGEITVTFRPPADSNTDTREPLTFPLEPDTATLEPTYVNLHESATNAYLMPTNCNEWFSSCVGYEVRLIYLGSNLRTVLFSGSKPTELLYSPVQTPSDEKPENNWPGYWSSLSNALSATANNYLPQSLTKQESPAQLTFTDCAPYLIVSSRSMDDIHHRLTEQDGTESRMDITKFRPNIVVSGAEEPWEEDYWRALRIGDDDDDDEKSGTRMVCVHNCGRCNSINVDYATGKVGTGEAGKILKKLQKDRRVDSGAKYSPVFGRYSFVMPGKEGREIRVGDDVSVVERNAERTKFDWKGLV